MTVDTGCRIVANEICVGTQQIHEEPTQAHDDAGRNQHANFLAITEHPYELIKYFHVSSVKITFVCKCTHK